jgi:hypothetical protein
VAAALQKIPGLDVRLVNGAKGEFTVLVDGHEVIRKGEQLPSVNEAVKAVKEAAPAKHSV